MDNYKIPQEILAKQLNELRLENLQGVKCSLSDIVKEITVQTKAKNCSIFLTHSPDKLVLAATTYSPLCHQIGRAYYHSGEGLTGWVFKYGKELNLRNLTSARA